MDARDDLIGKVQSGEMKPDEGEAEAARLGLKQLAFKPDARAFDPMRETFWTLPMAVAWIAYRTPDAVREWWQDYRAQCRHWLYMDRWKGEGQSGYDLVPWSSASLAGLRMNDGLDARPDRDADYSMTIKDAANALFGAIRSGCFEAVARDAETGERHTILAIQWRDLALVENWDGERFCTRVGEGRGPVKYTAIIVPSGAVRGLWDIRKPAPDPVLLPELWPMDRGGHMPLYCAAQWIATKGGAVIFDPLDVERWKPAFAELLSRISSDEVGVTGFRNGMREPIPGYHFADVSVSYPFADTPIEIILGDDLYLQSYPYGGEEHWKAGFDDTLEKRNISQWSRILVPCANVLKHWAFDDKTLWRTGAAGRPSSASLVIEEFRRRQNAGISLKRIGEESRILSAWLQTEHPQAPKMSPVTIATTIRARFNSGPDAGK